MLAHAGEGSNWHLATPPHAMQQLTKEFGVGCECFASPLNATTPSFCSAFVDTDAPFGGMGGFFSYNFASGGSFEVGPPYNRTVVSLVAQKLQDVLQQSEDHGVPFAQLRLCPVKMCRLDSVLREILCTVCFQELPLHSCVSFPTGSTTWVFSS